ncbi:MAG: T9SS type A sorting domain-containing protein [Lacinutrix sp.]|uniref:T9SS type A sorting domain-containing protein n=1 Tax=Lacinutrix sp. TaxID=1937692 RepID=UPI003094F3CC
MFKQNQGANEILFAGTELGVYFKVGAANWEKLGQNFPNVTINDIEINYTVDKLVAGTYGRGLWEISIDNNTLGVDEVEISDTEKPVIYPNPANQELNIKLSSNSSNLDYVIYNVIGGFVKKGELNSMLNTLDIKGVASGIYVVRMSNGN